MRERKTSSKASRSRSSRVSKLKSTGAKKTQSSRQAKVAAASRKDYQKKISLLNAQWKERIKKIETNALEKARHLFEREFCKKDEARQKAIASALAKFEKQYTQKTQRTSSSTMRRKPSSTARRSASRSTQRRSASSLSKRAKSA